MSTPWLARLVKTRSTARVTHRRADRRRGRPGIEALEGRQLLSGVYYVSNTNDSGAGSLRRAILDSNASPIVASTPTTTGLGGGAAASAPFNLIEFELPVGSVISPKSALPAITVPVETFTPTNFVGGSFKPSIVLDGTNAGAGTVGLDLKTSGSYISGLAVDHFSGGGVLFDGAAASSDWLENDYLGVALDGVTAAGNGTFGVELRNGASGNVIFDNVISANSGNGVVLTGAGTSHNTLQSNMIGTDATGTRALGNGGSGVEFLAGASNNTVGPNDVISANGYYGVYFSDAGTSGNVVAGNFIGTDVTGTHALGNGVNGVEVLGGASGNTIGGTTAGARNIISGNAGTGVVITQTGTSYNLVEGNYIGTDVAGNHALGNGVFGVILSGGATENTIGGAYAGDGNVISGNTYGVYITDAGTSYNFVQQDLVGVNAAGNAAVGGGYIGVYLCNGASSDAVYDNVIGGNAFGVVILGAGTTNNFVYFNDIGTDASGTLDLGNSYYGVYVMGSSGNYVIYNTIANSGYYGIVTSHADSNTYAYNNVYNNPYGVMATY